jgi:hypothetical protein
MTLPLNSCTSATSTASCTRVVIVSAHAGINDAVAYQSVLARRLAARHKPGAGIVCDHDPVPSEVSDNVCSGADSQRSAEDKQAVGKGKV